MLKKTLSLLLVLALALGTTLCLGACGGNGNNGGNSGDNTGDNGSGSNDGKVTYTVTVLDGTTPVSGVKVQIVNKDTEAKKIVTTDADGKATMTDVAGRYEAALFYASGYSDYDKSFKDFGADNSLTFNLESDSDDEGEGYTYTIYLKDQNGAPISGVRVQICEELCKAPVLTDAEGKAVYTDIDSASFKAQITSAVEGYEEPAGGWGAKYSFNSDFEVTITLTTK